MIDVRRARKVLVLAAALATMSSLPAAEAKPPLRSGTIVGGLITTGPSHYCQAVPDCLAWLTSACSPTLTGQDPAWLTSIVDVAGLADGRTRRSVSWTGIFNTPYIQFWRADCLELNMHRHFRDEKTRSIKPFVIPKDAKWMTVVGNAGFALQWTLS